jgi:hypothetical protein
LDAVRHYSILCNGISALSFVWLISSPPPVCKRQMPGLVQTVEMLAKIRNKRRPIMRRIPLTTVAVALFVAMVALATSPSSCLK